jgi:hypothetical protein
VSRTPKNLGEVAILNVGDGDTKLTFDPTKPAERKRAASVVTDMLKRGFAIFVQVGEKDGKPLYSRAETFDPETCEYLIVGTPEENTDEPSPAPGKRRGRPPGTRIKAESTRTVAVGRSAGG